MITEGHAATLCNFHSCLGDRSLAATLCNFHSSKCSVDRETHLSLTHSVNLIHLCSGGRFPTATLCKFLILSHFCALYQFSRSQAMKLCCCCVVLQGREGLYGCVWMCGPDQIAGIHLIIVPFFRIRLCCREEKVCMNVSGCVDRSAGPHLIIFPFFRIRLQEFI